jgi:G3E family GTPase
MSLFEPDRSAQRTPVSVITGFLGSGKTTLLNRLLRAEGMADSAVIINEFGEIGLDHLLVERLDGEVAVMANGCICCTVRSDLEETLRMLLARRDAGEVPHFARILVETTGLADPAPIVQLLLANPLVSHFVRLDAVVVTVDAVNAPRQLDEHEEAVKQVAIADRLLLTKMDLAAPGAAAPLRSRLAALNPAAPVVEVAHGVVAPDRLFGAALFDPARKTADVRRWLAEAAYDGHDHHGHDHHHDHHDHHHHDQSNHGPHDARIRAFSMAFETPLDWDLVSRWLAVLRHWRGADLLRVKGILNIAGEDAPLVVHGVHHVFHPPVRLAAWPDDDRRSRLVFITRDLDRAELEATLREAGVVPAHGVA